MEYTNSTDREKGVANLQAARVFVGNIPYNATEAELTRECEVFGPVASFKLVMDNSTGTHRGYGFCQFRDEETALSALRNQKGLICRGRQLRLDRPTIKEPLHIRKRVNLAQKPPPLLIKDPPQLLCSTSSLRFSNPCSTSAGTPIEIEAPTRTTTNDSYTYRKFDDLDEPVGFDLASSAADAATLHADFHTCTDISTDLIYKISCLSKKDLFLQLSFLQQSMVSHVDPVEAFPDVAQLMFLLERIAALIRQSSPAYTLLDAKRQEPKLRDDNHMQGDNEEKQAHSKEEAAPQLSSDAQQYPDQHQAMAQTAPTSKAAYAFTLPYLPQAQQYHEQQQAVRAPLSSSCSLQAAELYPEHQPIIMQNAATQFPTAISNWSVQARQYQDHQQIMKQIASSEVAANDQLPPMHQGSLHQQAFLPHQLGNGYMPHQQQLPAVPANHLSPGQLLQQDGHHPSPDQQQTSPMPCQYSGGHPTNISHVSHQQAAQPEQSKTMMSYQHLPDHRQQPPQQTFQKQFEGFGTTRSNKRNGPNRHAPYARQRPSEALRERQTLHP